MRRHTIDLTDPSGKGEVVEVKTPAGIVRVNAGLVKPLTMTPVVVIELHCDLEWAEETRVSPTGRTDIVWTKVEE